MATLPLRKGGHVQNRPHPHHQSVRSQRCQNKPSGSESEVLKTKSETEVFEDTAETPWDDMSRVDLYDIAKVFEISTAETSGVGPKARC